MKIKLFLILTALWLYPGDGLASISCYGPNGSFAVGCDESRSPTEICESAGYKFSAVLRSTVYCMDKNCLVGDRYRCTRCRSDYLLNASGLYQCSPCPAGATCDGTDQIVSCPDGFYVNGNTCRSCHSNCATCINGSSSGCTSCRSGYYLAGASNVFQNGARIAPCSICPINATCPGGTSSFTCNEGYSRLSSTANSCTKCAPSCKSCENGKLGFCTACYSGYKPVNGQCVEEEEEPTKTNTVNTCPSRMTLSADGCCCVNK